MNAALHSSASTMWSTPQWLFDKLNEQYNFNTDVCAIAENAKCIHYFSPEQNGLIQNWTGNCWMNPPYGRTYSYWWVKKAYEQFLQGVFVVALLPARTDTKWFHEYIYNKEGVTVEFLKGRLKFGNGEHAAPFPSMIVLFGKPQQ